MKSSFIFKHRGIGNWLLNLQNQEGFEKLMIVTDMKKKCSSNMLKYKNKLLFNCGIN